MSLKTEATSAGTVLAGGQGWTLYYFTEDKPGGPSGMPPMLELRAANRLLPGVVLPVKVGRS